MPRPEARQLLQPHVDGLFSGVEHKTGWQPTEVHGRLRPTGCSISWDGRSGRKGQRAALYTYITDYPGDPKGVVVMDDTDFLKQETHSIGRVADC